MTENQKMDLMISEMTDIKTKITEIENEVKDIYLTLENETNHNIKLIAEGHLDLHRKLDNAMKFEKERELLLIRVNILESDLRKVKTRLEIV